MYNKNTKDISLHKVFGGSNTVKVFDYLLDQKIDVSVADICMGTDLSRKTVDNIINDLKNLGIIKETRNVGKTKLFFVNDQNQIVQLLRKINKIIIKQKEKSIRDT